MFLERVDGEEPVTWRWLRNVVKHFSVVKDPIYRWAEGQLQPVLPLEIGFECWKLDIEYERKR